MLKRALRWIVCSIPVVGIALAVSAGWGKEVVKDPTDKPAEKGPLQFKVKDIDGKEQDLADYKGKVVLIVNVASKCGNTPQYKGLEAIYEKYKEKGLVVIGFPANNFGKQEPGTDEQIKEFCSSTYNVAFPMMSKISVKGNDKASLYKQLTEKETAGDFAGEVEWKFGKFLIALNGTLMAPFKPVTNADNTVT